MCWGVVVLVRSEVREGARRGVVGRERGLRVRDVLRLRLWLWLCWRGGALVGVVDCIVEECFWRVRVEGRKAARESRATRGTVYCSIQDKNRQVGLGL